MDRKYLVFLSSTAMDLEKEREKAIETILRAGCIPCAMEYFSVTEHDRMEFLEQMVACSDLIVFIVAGKYGSSPPRSIESYTELEYEYALKHDKPVIALLYYDLDKLPRGDVEIDPSRFEMLKRFRTNLGENRNSGLWKSVDDLVGRLGQSLNSWKESNESGGYPQEGWVRATKDNARIMLGDTASGGCLPRSDDFYFDCTEQRYIDDLVKASDVRILGANNKHIISLFNKAFNIRIQQKRENPKWDKVTVVFLDRDLLEYLDSAEEPIKIKEEWDQTVSGLRRQLQLWSLKEDIRIYNRFFPFVGQLFDERHLRIVHILSGSNSEHQCYSNIIGNAMPCEFLKNRPDTNSCKMLNRPGVVPATIESIRSTFERILKTSRSALTVNFTGEIEYCDSEPEFVFEQVLPNSDWSKVKFRNSIGKGRIPVYVVVLVLLIHKGKIVLQMRTANNSATVKGKYALQAGKVQDEDFFEDSGRDMEYSHQLDELMMSYHARCKTEASYQKFLADMDSLTESFASRTNITVGSAPPRDLFEKACKRAVSRTLLEKLGCELGVDPFPQDRYPIKFYLEIKHSSVENSEEAEYHRIFTKLYICDINRKEYLRICDRIPGHHLKEFSLEKFAALYATNATNSYDETELTPFVMLNYESLYEYVKDLQNNK